MASITKRPDGVWRARFRDETGKEHTRHFARKVDGQRWLDEVTSSVVTGSYVDPQAGTLPQRTKHLRFRRRRPPSSSGAKHGCSATAHGAGRRSLKRACTSG